VVEICRETISGNTNGDARGGAQYNLGICYANGEGVAKDQVKAAKWYRKAAEQNHAKAQFNLGGCYVNGEGVAKDYVEAYKWYLLSAKQGDEEAKKFIPVLANRITPEQIAEGQTLARNFKPR
jgi:TPR repeat protein